MISIGIVRHDRGNLDKVRRALPGLHADDDISNPVPSHSFVCKRTAQLAGLAKGFLSALTGLAVYETLGSLLYVAYWNGTNEGIAPAVIPWSTFLAATVSLSLWLRYCRLKTSRILAGVYVVSMAAWILSGLHANDVWLILTGRQTFDPVGEVFNIRSKTALLLFFR